MPDTDQSKIYQQIRDEHESLRQLLGDLHQVLTGRSETPDRVAEKIVSLQKHLSAHFVEEEEEGFFDEIIGQAPRLVDRAGQLREEHASLREAIEQLARIAAKQAGTAPWWEELDERFHQLSRQLMHHEHKENELLQEAYEEDIGSKD